MTGPHVPSASYRLAVIRALLVLLDRARRERDEARAVAS